MSSETQDKHNKNKRNNGFTSLILFIKRTDLKKETSIHTHNFLFVFLTRPETCGSDID